VGAVVLPVTGVAVGTAQVVRGAVNTPEAIKQASAGKHWDAANRRWIDPPGNALVVDGDATAAARRQWRRQQQRAHSGGGGGEAEEDFYELLGVERDASSDEIKRQYYLLARRYALPYPGVPSCPLAHCRRVSAPCLPRGSVAMCVLLARTPLAPMWGTPPPPLPLQPAP
jgi:hypothetical protein